MLISFLIFIVQIVSLRCLPPHLFLFLSYYRSVKLISLSLRSCWSLECFNYWLKVLLDDFRNNLNLISKLIKLTRFPSLLQLSVHCSSLEMKFSDLIQNTKIQKWQITQERTATMRSIVEGKRTRQERWRRDPHANWAQLRRRYFGSAVRENFQLFVIKIYLLISPNLCARYRLCESC